MASPSKRKGDRSERELCALLSDLTGYDIRRALGAGRKDDVGDIHGVPSTVVQVCDYAPKYLANALRQKPLDAERQAQHNGDFAATFVRLRGGEYRVVLTPEQWAAMWREAQ